jgi:thioredoxin
MKHLNWIVGALMMAVLAPLLFTPTPPPEDRWFQNAVISSTRPVLVKFGADWCPPCRHMETVLDQAHGRLAGRVKIVRINIDEKPELAQHYGVHAIPQLFLFDHGRIIASHGGFADASQLQNWVKARVQ